MVQHGCINASRQAQSVMGPECSNDHKGSELCSIANGQRECSTTAKWRTHFKDTPLFYTHCFRLKENYHIILPKINKPPPPLWKKPPPPLKWAPLKSLKKNMSPRGLNRENTVSHVKHNCVLKCFQKQLHICLLSGNTHFTFNIDKQD